MITQEDIKAALLQSDKDLGSSILNSDRIGTKIYFDLVSDEKYLRSGIYIERPVHNEDTLIVTVDNATRVVLESVEFSIIFVVDEDNRRDTEVRERIRGLTNSKFFEGFDDERTLTTSKEETESGFVFAYNFVLSRTVVR